MTSVPRSPVPGQASEEADEDVKVGARVMAERRSHDVENVVRLGMWDDDVRAVLVAVSRAREGERNHWIRLFNRLENAVRRHAEAKAWTDDADDALHAAHRSVLRAAFTGRASSSPEGGSSK